MTKWPTFDGQTIIGWKLLKFVDWVAASDPLSTDSTDAESVPILAPPPMQRSAVWRPKQVVDLWDSLMRGLPIGLFYLVDWSAHSPRKTTSLSGKQVHATFELLDGQQRARALLVGIRGPSGERSLWADERCLWVDLDPKTTHDERPFLLRITSKPQPFGYDIATGGKLRLDERRKARERIEPDPKNHPILFLHEDGTPFLNEDGKPRRAYNLELFDGRITKDGKPIEQPPKPYGATTEQTFKLHELLSAWRDGGNDSLFALAVGAPESALRALERAFANIKRAQIALLRVDPVSLSDDSHDLLALFERIGAGGTPLTPEERLYSIYKHYVPEIRHAVETIYQDAGRVLPPTKIAATALRIANARKERPSYYVPNVTDFGGDMAKVPSSELRRKLEELISERPEKTRLLHDSFVKIKGLLSYSDHAGAFWIPDVLLASLPAGLWHVLVFWVSQWPTEGRLGESRKEAVRFALFWYLCCWNDDKAASWCFEYIRDNKDGQPLFPGAPLYRRLNGNEWGDPCAYGLISPDEFESKLCRLENPGWRTDAERFGKDNDRNQIGSNWWWNGKKMLPWLQRDYIRRVFPDYSPLTEHEDDVPYDVDHICPHNDWREDWRTIQRRLDIDDGLKKRVYDCRDAVGWGIGNLRLIESSRNRHDQDADVADKMPFILCDQESAICDIEAMADSAFAPEQRELWKRVSRRGPLKERQWNRDRLAAFQNAVEQRAAWLYRRFHDDLGYGSWTLLS